MATKPTYDTKLDASNRIADVIIAECKLSEGTVAYLAVISATQMAYDAGFDDGEEAANEERARMWQGFNDYMSNKKKDLGA
jgi:mannitol-1-phosphate/altronate dehydrogenase